MAYCPNCQYYIDPQEIQVQEIVCPKCQLELRFNRKEYKLIVRPGLYIVGLFLFNSFMTENHLQRVAINFVILLLWFAFYIRFKNYLKETSLEKFSYES